jgi:ABC-2 type transport system ATP-binding protein
VTAPMIHIENLEKSYGATRALKGITFDVPRGQVVGFLGPNGAGKSTTMKILTGYIEREGGVVQVAGIDVQSAGVEAKRHVGYLPENNPLYEDMMVEEYLGYTATVREVPSDKRARAIATAVERCGLGDVRGKDIGELSKGFRQRVGLAQAILHEPDLLILDEPTTGLDPNQVVAIRDLIKELGREKTVILSTHVLPEVQHMCSRAVIIADGKLVADGAPDALAAEENIVDVTVTGKDGSIDGAKAKAALTGVIGVSAVSAVEADEAHTARFRLTAHGKTDVRRAVFDKCVEHDLVILNLSRRQVSLEETFRKLTTKEGPK